MRDVVALLNVLVGDQRMTGTRVYPAMSKTRADLLSPTFNVSVMKHNRNNLSIPFKDHLQVSQLPTRQMAAIF